MKLPTVNPSPLSSGFYKTDQYNLNPIFSVTLKNKQNTLFVRSWEEAFFLNGEAFITDINPSYVAALISNVQTINTSPYLRIKRLPRSSFIQLHNNSDIKIFPYEPFSGGASFQNEMDLHSLIDYIFQDRLSKEISSSSKIGCELSSGLDSNSIVGGLIKGLEIDPNHIYTWSHAGNGEEDYIKQFYKFHNLKKSNCFLNKNQYKKVDFLKSLKENLLVFGMPHQLGGNTGAVKYFKNCSCEILFSGFGGDQGISHNGNNLATDLIKSFEIIEFFKWMDNPVKALRTMIGRTYGFINNEWQENKFSKKVSNIKENNLLVKLLTDAGKDWLMPHFSKEFINEIDTYSPLHDSIKKRCTSEWIAVRIEEETRLAAKYGIKKVFPLLDETIIGTLLNQDPKYFAEKYNLGRSIIRKSFSKYLPEILRTDPRKNRELNNQWLEIERENQRNILNDLIEFSQSWNKNLKKYWDLDSLQILAIDSHKDIKNTDINKSSKIIKSMRTINKLSCWFSELE